MQALAAVVMAAVFLHGSPASTDNDDTCDIATTPAATLLLPGFEVAVSKPRAIATSTLITVVNVAPQPHIARVTLWTDLAHPVMTFNLALGGYGTESVDLYDVFTRGTIARHHTAPIDGCTDFANDIPDGILHEAVMALTSGITASCPLTRVGTQHEDAIGYATIDVVANCSDTFPTSPAYFQNDLLYDNVLIGDSEQIWTGQGDAVGTPLVHIRAVPEGGPAGSVVATNLPYTFYDRYTSGLPSRTMDRRQPLPSMFAARLRQELHFVTTMTMWRETYGPAASCAALATEGRLYLPELVMFDEHENLTSWQGGCCCVTCPVTVRTTLPLLIRPTTDEMFPTLATSGDTGGWLYLNLNNGGSPAYSAAHPGFAALYTAGPRASQNWVTVTMANDRYSVRFDATPLANGCSSGKPTGAWIGSGSAVCPPKIQCVPEAKYLGTNTTP
jgi:hypothetical protein